MAFFLMVRHLHCHRDITRGWAIDTAFVPSGIELNYHNLLAHEAYGI